MFWSSKKKGRKDRDKHLESLMVLSQQHLLNAATDTANAAHDVTTKLKARLDDSIRQFENTARILNDGLFLTEMDGTIQSCNPAAGRMFGRSELIGLNIAELFQLGDDRLTTAQAFWVIAEQSSDWLPNNLVPLKARRPCGTLFWFEPSVTRLDWSNGASSMLVLIRNMEPIVGLAAQAKANRGYKKLFDASLEGIMIEQNDRIVAANPAITQLWGYTSEEIMNRPIAVLFEPSETDRVEANDVHSNFGVQGQHSDGHHMSLVFTATRITWNNRTARLITIRDADELPSQGTGARQDNGVDMICCFDLDYRITFANTAFLRRYGLTRNETMNRDIRFLMTDTETSAFMANIQGLTVSMPSSRIQIQEGTEMYDWIDHAVFDDDGVAIEFQRVGRDISDVVASLAPAA